MTNLLEHHNLCHKDQDYVQSIIKTQEDFDMWHQNVSGKDFIFRGQVYAKYKNYSSGQRKWMQDPDLMDKLGDDIDVYTDYITKLISKCREWENGIIEKYLGKDCDLVSDLMLLSIMQHYGVPTPLIDFTYDINVALYFACSNNKSFTRTDSIDDYMSVYFINLKENDNRIIKQSDNSELKFKSYKELASLKKLILIDNDKSILYSNLNIIAQKGVLLLNYHPWKYLGGLSTNYKIANGKIDVSIELPELPNNIPVLYNINCTDIHKNLVPYIKAEYLNHLNNLFPKYEELANYLRG